MLLQSYSGTIRVFPAIPASWKDVSFKTLRAEGAFLVSAERKVGVTQRVEIIAEKGGLLRLENPFPGASYAVTGIDPGSVKMDGADFIVTTTPGQRLSLSRK